MFSLIYVTIIYMLSNILFSWLLLPEHENDKDGLFAFCNLPVLWSREYTCIMKSSRLRKIVFTLTPRFGNIDSNVAPSHIKHSLYPWNSVINLPIQTVQEKVKVFSYNLWKPLIDWFFFKEHALSKIIILNNIIEKWYLTL